MDIVVDDLLRDEWSPMTVDKVLGLRAELSDWKSHRKEQGYDFRLLEGAISVCNEYITRRR